MIQTSTKSPVLIHDLLPATEYKIQLRSHPTSAPSVVWHWRNASHSDVAFCQTAKTNSPITELRRCNETYAEKHAVVLQWHFDQSILKKKINQQDEKKIEIRFRRIGTHDVPLNGTGIFEDDLNWD